MAVYNTSFMNNATNVVDLAVGIGTQAGDQFLMGYLILLAFFLIYLIMAVRYNFLEVLVTDSFLCIIIAIFLFAIGMLPIVAMIFPLLILIIGLVMLLVR